MSWTLLLLLFCIHLRCSATSLRVHPIPTVHPCCYLFFCFVLLLHFVWIKEVVWMKMYTIFTKRFRVPGFGTGSGTLEPVPWNRFLRHITTRYAGMSSATFQWSKFNVRLSQWRGQTIPYSPISESSVRGTAITLVSAELRWRRQNWAIGWQTSNRYACDGA